MWMHHLFSFMGTVASYFFNAIGTTVLGVFLGLAIVCAGFLATMRRIQKLQGRDAMLKHWEENAKIAGQSAIICAICIYSPILLWKVCQAVFDDHTALVERSRVQRGTIGSHSIELQKLKSDDLKSYNDLRVECATTTGSNGTLQNQNRDQQNSINNCQDRAMSLLTPTPLQLTAVMLIPAITNEEGRVVGEHHEAEFLLLTNRKMDDVKIVAKCNHPLLAGGASPARWGAMSNQSISALQSERSVLVGYGGTPFTPTNPAYLHIIYTGDVNSISCDVFPQVGVK